MIEKNSFEIEAYAKQDGRVLVAIGSIEQHGPHLPIGTDYIIAEAIAKKVSEETGVIRVPTIFTGMSEHHSQFPGHISLKPIQLISLLKSILEELIAQDYSKLLIMNAHNGNRAAIKSSVMELQLPDDKVEIKVINVWDSKGIVQCLEKAFGTERGFHAGAGETSVMLHLAPHLVRLEACEEYVAGGTGINRRSYSAVSPYAIKKLFPWGIFGGNPTKANAQLGGLLFEKMIRDITRELEEW